MASVAMTGSVSHPNCGGNFCVSFKLRVISACCPGYDEIDSRSGVLNLNVRLSGTSVREDPLARESIQVSVVRFVVPACSAES